MQIKEFVDTTMKVISYIIDHDYSDGKAYIFKDEYGFIRRKNEFNICRLGIYKGGLVINETPRFYGSTLFDIEKTSKSETETISITPAYIIKLLFEKYKYQNSLSLIIPSSILSAN